MTVPLFKRSILTQKIARRGQHVVQEYAIDPYELARLSEIMTRDVGTLPAAMSVAKALDFFSDTRNSHDMYPIVDGDGRLLGAATRADALRWRDDADIHPLSIEDVVSDVALPLAFPDEVVGRIVDRMVAGEIGRMTVVERKSGRLVGIVSRKDLLRIRVAADVLEQTREAFYLRGKRRR